MRAVLRLSARSILRNWQEEFNINAEGFKISLAIYVKDVIIDEISHTKEFFQ